MICPVPKVMEREKPTLRVMMKRVKAPQHKFLKNLPPLQRLSGGRGPSWSETYNFKRRDIPFGVPPVGFIPDVPHLVRHDTALAFAVEDVWVVAEYVISLRWCS